MLLAQMVCIRNRGESLFDDAGFVSCRLNYDDNCFINQVILYPDLKLTWVVRLNNYMETLAVGLFDGTATWGTNIIDSLLYPSDSCRSH